MIQGTPHHGSSIASCAKVVANIVKACSPLSPVTSILRVLQRDSKVLFDIMEDLVGKTETLHIVSFEEMKMTTFGSIKRMVRLTLERSTHTHTHIYIY